MASAGGHGGHAGPLGLYWTVDAGGKKRKKQTKRIYEQEATSEQQVSIT